MIKSCDNFSACHDPYVISEDNEAIRWICNNCKESGIIKKDFRGVPDNIQYSKVFKKEVLQGNDNLFYKYYNEHLKT